MGVERLQRHLGLALTDGSYPIFFPARKGTVKKLIRKLLIDYSVHITIVFCIFAAAGIWASRSIELKMSLADLFPQDHPNAIKFNKLTEAADGVGYHELLLHAEDGKSHLEIATHLAEKLKEFSIVRGAFRIETRGGEASPMRAH